MKPTWVWLTPNERAKIGIAGTTIPNPTATKKDATTRTRTSRGNSLKDDLAEIGLTRGLPLLHLRERPHNPYLSSVVLRAGTRRQ